MATIYLTAVWLDAVGSNLPARVLPRPIVFFAQTAALFKSAGLMAIDYRAEGWDCREQKWREIDTRPFFRVDAEHKENRFHRAMQFYRRERKVMRALDEFVVTGHNARHDGKIGGVRFLSLRVPYPPLGGRVERYARRPLASYPPEIRHDWYWTPRSRRAERCGERRAPAHEDDDGPRAAPDDGSKDEP